jgi:hypothetical protein
MDTRLRLRTSDFGEAVELTRIPHAKALTENHESVTTAVSQHSTSVPLPAGGLP